MLRCCCTSAVCPVNQSCTPLLNSLNYLLNMNIISSLGTVETKLSILQEISKDDSPEIINIRSSRSDSVLNKLTSSLTEQEKYFEAYQARRIASEEIYYKIYNKAKMDRVSGLVRITELGVYGKFSWESFILVKGTPPPIALDVMITIYALGFITLNKNICGPWKVPKSGIKIFSLHENVGMAEKVGEDESNHLMCVRKQDFFSRYGFFKNKMLGVSNDPALLGF
jgi:hypothetical protein